MSKNFKAKIAFKSSSDITSDGTKKTTKLVVLAIKWNQWLKTKGLTDTQITTLNKAIIGASSSIATILTVVLACLGGAGVI